MIQLVNFPLIVFVGIGVGYVLAWTMTLEKNTARDEYAIPIVRALVLETAFFVMFIPAVILSHGQDDLQDAVTALAFATAFGMTSLSGALVIPGVIRYWTLRDLRMLGTCDFCGQRVRLDAPLFHGTCISHTDRLGNRCTGSGYAPKEKEPDPR